jgi:cytochrome P450
MTVIYNPFDPSFIENPYPTLKQLRDEEPVYKIVAAEGVWLLTRYDDINEILHDRDRYSVDHKNLKRGPELEGVPYEDLAVILFRDPPEHTRWRRLLSTALTPAHVDAFKPRVSELIDELLDTIAEKGEVDFVQEFSVPLPFRIISEMLGTPVEDRPQLFKWVEDVVNITEPVATPEVSQAIVRSNAEMRDYMRDLVKYKRAHPGDDIITRLVEANDGSMTEEELLGHIALLQVSAPDPTSNLLAYGTLAFARHPEQAKILRDDPSLDGNAVEEMLRYEAPLQITGRYSTEDVELHGVRIEAGTAIVMSIASANHDESKWGPTGDDLDIRRERPQDHLSFARGIHTCFGSQLARLQGHLTFGRLVRRFPDLTLAAPPKWNSLLNRRGPTEVTISVR